MLTRDSVKQDSQHVQQLGVLNSLEKSVIPDPIETRRQAIIDSLVFDDQHSREVQIQPAQSQTFEWIFEKNGKFAAFSTWLKSPAPLFWVSGKPGSGKSTLMKFIAKHKSLTEHLAGWASSRPLLVLSHYLFLPGTPLMKDISGLMRSLLQQALTARPELSEHDVFCDFDRSRIKQSQTVPDLMSTMEAILRSETGTCFFLLLDGLDEQDGKHFERRDLIDFILRISRLDNVKVCVSSRPEFLYQETFGDGPSLRLQDLTLPDMETTAWDLLKREPNFRILLQSEPSPIHRLVSTLCSQAEGVFLWLCLAIFDLATGIHRHDTLDSLFDRLKMLGSSLDDLFEKLLGNIAPVDRPIAARIFHELLKSPEEELSLLWLLLILKPEKLKSLLQYPKVSAQEVIPIPLAEAGTCFIDIQRFRKLIPTYCAGLVEFVPSNHSTFARARSCYDCETLSLDKCRTCSDGLDVSNFYTILQHVESQRLSFIHKGAFEFLATNPKAIQYCRSFQNASNDGLEISISDTKISLRSLFSFTLYVRDEGSRDGLFYLETSSRYLRFMDKLQEAAQDVYAQEEPHDCDVFLREAFAPEASIMRWVLDELVRSKHPDFTPRSVHMFCLTRLVEWLSNTTEIEHAGVLSFLVAYTITRGGRSSWQALPLSGNERPYRTWDLRGFNHGVDITMLCRSILDILEKTNSHAPRGSWIWSGIIPQLIYSASRATQAQQNYLLSSLERFIGEPEFLDEYFHVGPFDRAHPGGVTTYSQLRLSPAYMLCTLLASIFPHSTAFFDHFRRRGARRLIAIRDYTICSIYEPVSHFRGVRGCFASTPRVTTKETKAKIIDLVEDCVRVDSANGKIGLSSWSHAEGSVSEEPIFNQKGGESLHNLFLKVLIFGKQAQRLHKSIWEFSESNCSPAIDYKLPGRTEENDQCGTDDSSEDTGHEAHNLGTVLAERPWLSTEKGAPELHLNRSFEEIGPLAGTMEQWKVEKWLDANQFGHSLRRHGYHFRPPSSRPILCCQLEPGYGYGKYIPTDEEVPWVTILDESFTSDEVDEEGEAPKKD